MSIAKLAILLNSMGYKAVSLTGWQAGIYTTNDNMNAKIESIDTRKIESELENNKIVIVAGFQGIDKNGNITTLGRGGSDTTAVAIASCINADFCYIYSDVDGVYTADPKRIVDAKKINKISYDEMLELSSEGAKVLHDRCIEIAKKFNIPIIAKGTFNSNNGTVVENEIENFKPKSIVKNDSLIYITLEGNLNNVYEFIINSLKISANHFYISDNKIEFIIKKEKLYEIEKMLSNFKNITIKYHEISRIAIVGEGMLNKKETIEKIIEILKEENIDVKKINISGNRIDITLNNRKDDIILKKLHRLLFE